MIRQHDKGYLLHFAVCEDSYIDARSGKSTLNCRELIHYENVPIWTTFIGFFCRPMMVIVFVSVQKVSLLANYLIRFVGQINEINKQD